MKMLTLLLVSIKHVGGGGIHKGPGMGLRRSFDTGGNPLSRYKTLSIQHPINTTPTREKHTEKTHNHLMLLHLRNYTSLFHTIILIFSPSPTPSPYESLLSGSTPSLSSSSSLDAISALLMCSKEEEDEAKIEPGQGQGQGQGQGVVQGKDNEKKREISDGVTTLSPVTLSGKQLSTLRPSASASSLSSLLSAAKINGTTSAAAGESRPGTGGGVGVGVEVGSRPGTGVDINASQTKPSSAVGTGMPNYLKPIGYVFKSLGN